MPRVTVCMAVYNGARHMSAALDAVFAQTYRDFEVLVLDDGSTDESPAIAAKYPCRVISTPNGGLGAARKRMVEEASGEWIAFVDHDDFWLPKKLESQVECLGQTGASLVHSDGWYVYEDGREVERNLNLSDRTCAIDHILPSNLIIASTALFNREAMLEAGNFVSDTVRCSDWYGWMVLAKGRKFFHQPEKLVRYNVLGTSLANAGYRFHQAQFYLLWEKLIPMADSLFEGLSDGDKRRYLRMLVQRSGIALSSMARSLERQGQRKESRVLHKRALRLAPTTPRVLSRYLRSLVTP